MTFLTLVLGLSLLTSGVFGIQGFDVTCENGVTVTFSFTFIEEFSYPRYRLERDPKTSEENCVGELALPTVDIGNSDAVTYRLIELGEGVFSKLPLVTSINIATHRFRASNLGMYTDSPLIESMDAQYNYFPQLDSSMRFPPSLKKLKIDRQSFFYFVKGEFFEDHPQLTEIDISDPFYVPEFTYEEGIFQNVKNLERLKMVSMPVSILKKSLLSGHASSLKYVDMTRWLQLTSVEENAFINVSLEELDLSEWPFLSISDNLFSGASIKKLILRRSKIENLQSGGLAGLEAQELDLSGSKLTNIEAGSFDNFVPLDNFKLVMPKDISCCNLDGLRELITLANVESINGNSQNYTCTTPDGDERVVDHLLNADPTLELACCDYQSQYYDSENKSCERCKEQPLCTESSEYCQGEETDLRTCNECNFGYAVNPFECQQCIPSSDCVVSTGECSLSEGNENIYKCQECTVGLFPNATTGICEACIELSPSCTNYDTVCLVDTNELACLACNDERELIDGRCVEVTRSALLPLGGIIGLSLGIVVLVASVSIIVLGVLLYRRKKRKEKEIRKACGITKNESGVEIFPVEYDESESNKGPTGVPNTKDIEKNAVSVNAEYHNNVVASEYHNGSTAALIEPQNDASSEYYNNAMKTPSSTSEYHNNTVVDCVEDDKNIDSSAEYHNGVVTHAIDAEYHNNHVDATVAPASDST